MSAYDPKRTWALRVVAYPGWTLGGGNAN